MKTMGIQRFDPFGRLSYVGGTYSDKGATTCHACGGEGYVQIQFAQSSDYDVVECAACKRTGKALVPCVGCEQCAKRPATADWVWLTLDDRVTRIRAAVVSYHHNGVVDVVTAAVDGGNGRIARNVQYVHPNAAVDEGPYWAWTYDGKDARPE